VRHVTAGPFEGLGKDDLPGQLCAFASGVMRTEAAQVTEAAGLDAAAALEILAEGAAGSRLLKAKLPKMLKRDFSPQFALELMDKDLRYFLALAQDVDRPAPLAALVRNQYQAARRAELGKLDSSAVFLHAAGEKPRGQ